MNRFNVSAYAVKERSLTLYFILMIAIAGIYAFLHMGRAEDPTFSVNTMVVSAVWPGASALEIQNQVADPLEKQLEQVQYFDKVETKSRAGRVDMLVSFSDKTPPGMSTELYYQVRKRLGDEAMSLPSGVQGPFFNDDFDDVYFTLYSFTAKGWPQEKLVREADKMQIALRHVSGVKKVNLIGERDEKIFIDIDEERAAQLGLSLQSLTQAINGQLSITDSGFIETNGPRLYIRTGQGLDTQKDAVEQIKHLPLIIGGKQVFVQDIAKVSRGYENPPTYLVRDKGQDTILLGVVMASGTDGLELEKNLKSFEEQYNKQLPLGIKVDKLTNQANAINAAVSTFQVKFVTALFVVLIVSLIALGLRAGLIVALAVPLTLAMTFLFMFIDGLNFDRITLGALILSLGLLVDDAIIAIEMMLVKMEEGMDKAKAAAYSWSVTAAPMLVGTLVTVAGFLPIGLANSRVGEYAGNIFWVLGISLIASWIVAVYFTPYLGVKLLPEKLKHNPNKQDPYDTRFYRALRNLITFCVRRKFIVVLLTVVIFVLAVVGMNKLVVKQFFPSSDRPELMVDISLPEGTGINVTNEVTKKVEAVINQYDEVKSLSSYVGRGAPRFFLALNPELTNPSFAKIVVVTQGKDEREALQAKLRKLVNEGKFPEARVRVHPLLFGPPVTWPVSFRVVGPDPKELRTVAEELRVLIAKQSFAVDPHLEWGARVPTLHLDMNKARLAQLGLTSQEVAQQLQAQLQGVTAAQVGENIRTVNVMIRANKTDRIEVSELGSLMIKTANGTTLPIEQLGNINVKYEDPLLERRNRELYLSVNSELIPGIQPPVASGIIEKQMQPIIDKLPLGYRIDVGGSVEESAKAQDSIKVLVPLMILAMTLLIMLLVKSFSTMFMVLITAPLGLIGAVLALVLFNQPFGFVANLGLLGLAGILMRNTLILTGQINDHLEQGYSQSEAVIDATVRRARPVLLTAIAAMLAFIPLTHSTFWGPMAYVLIGGIGVGTLLTILFLPALYSVWNRIKVN
ncbi:efflux RND transporter permease subunit [Thiomicrorhabdus hydrogeniphila]